MQLSNEGHILSPFLDLLESNRAGTQPCDVKIEGSDKLLRNLTGGLDGVYEVWSCENGRPLYKRKKSPPGRKYSCLQSYPAYVNKDIPALSACLLRHRSSPFSLKIRHTILYDTAGHTDMHLLHGAEDRVLWYSAQYRDWDISNGSVAQEVSHP